MLKNRCGFDLTIRNETVLSRIVSNMSISYSFFTSCQVF